MRIVIFGGTTEGRELAEYFLQLNKNGTVQYEIHMFVATEYGARVLPEETSFQVHTGRLDAGQIQAVLCELSADLCLDATHPYAVCVTQNLYQACQQAQIPYIRIRREIAQNQENCVLVEDAQAAAEFLKETKGNILITTGSKELAAFTKIPDYETRCTVRVLPTPEVVEGCMALGFSGRHLICMQGPFDLELNRATLRYADAAWLVTKASGKKGGYDEKCEAALLEGVQLVVIGCPKETVTPVMTLQQAMQYGRQFAEANV